MVCLSLRSALALALNVSRTITSKPATSSIISNGVSRSTQHQQHAFSTSRSLGAENSQKQRKLAKQNKGPPDMRMKMIRYHLHHPTTLMPRPLKFSRNRSLRHWTIHRAWNLYRANLKRDRQLELERQFNAMNAANEHLRLHVGDGGKLFRRAQMKVGTWSIPERGGGIPIEYARAQVDFIGTVAGGVGGPAKVWDYGYTAR